MPEGMEGYLVESWVAEIPGYPSSFLDVAVSEIVEACVRSEYSQVFFWVNSEVLTQACRRF